MSRLLKILLLLLLFGLLILVRHYENQLFYDPLILFFKGNYHLGLFPDVNPSKLMTHIAFRFFVNTAISLLILYVVFRDMEIIRFSLILYASLFFILFCMMYFMVKTLDVNSNLTLIFYIRRFLIQPLFILLLLPAFYYFKKSDL